MTSTPVTAQRPVVDARLRSVLSAGSRPSPASDLSASLIFGWRGLLKIRRVPEQLLDVIAIPVIFTLLFTYLFGGALAGSPGRYLQFLLPGTLAMTVLLVTMYAGIGLNADIAGGAFDRFRSLPVWQAAPVIGSLLGDLGRYLLAAALVVGLGLALGFRPAAGPAGVLAATGLVVVFAFGLSWVWTAVGLIARTPGAIYSVATVILFPLTFASNVFVDPRTMPWWLQAFIRVNPISHLVTALRAAMDSTLTGGDLVWVVVPSAVLVLVFAPLTLHLYRSKQ